MTLWKKIFGYIIFILIFSAFIWSIISLINLLKKKKETFNQLAAASNTSILNSNIWLNLNTNSDYNKNYPELNVDLSNNFLIRNPDINNTSISISGDDIEGLKGYYRALKNLKYSDAEEYISSSGLASKFYAIYSFKRDINYLGSSIINIEQLNYLLAQYIEKLKNNTTTLPPNFQIDWSVIFPLARSTSNNLLNYKLDKNYPICINSIQDSDFRNRNRNITDTYYQPIYNPFWINNKIISMDIPSNMRKRPYEITSLYTGIGYNLKNTKYNISQTPLKVSTIGDPNLSQNNFINKFGISVANQTEFTRFFYNKPIDDSYTNTIYKLIVYYNQNSQNTNNINLNNDFITKVSESKENITSTANIYTKIEYTINSNNYISVIQFTFTNITIFGFTLTKVNDISIIMHSRENAIEPYNLLVPINIKNELFITLPWETSSIVIPDKIKTYNIAKLQKNSMYKYKDNKLNFEYNINKEQNSTWILSVSEATNNTVKQIEKNYATNFFKDNYKIKIIYGRGVEQYPRKIVSNTNNIFTITPDWQTIPNTTSKFIIIKNDMSPINFSQEDNTDHMYMSGINSYSIDINNNFYLGYCLIETVSFNGEIQNNIDLSNRLDINIMQNSLSDIVENNKINYKFWTKNMEKYVYIPTENGFVPNIDTKTININRGELINESNIDPLNLISLFRRKVKKILCLIPKNLTKTIDDNTNFCEIFLPFFKYYFDNAIFDTYKSSANSVCTIGLETDQYLSFCGEYNPCCGRISPECKSKLRYIYDQIINYSGINYGNMTITILKNESFGILETYDVNILFVSKTVNIKNLLSDNLQLNINFNDNFNDYFERNLPIQSFIFEQNLLKLKNDIDTIFMNPNIIKQPNLHFDIKDYNTKIIYKNNKKIIDKTGNTRSKDIICASGASTISDIVPNSLNSFDSFKIDNVNNPELCYTINTDSWFYANILSFVIKISNITFPIPPNNYEIISINLDSCYFKLYLNSLKNLCLESYLITGYNSNDPIYKKSIIQIPFLFDIPTLVIMSYQNNHLKLKTYTQLRTEKTIVISKDIPVYSLCIKGEIKTKLYYNSQPYYIGEIIQYNQQLIEYDILSLEKYLLHKWNFKNILTNYSPILFYDSMFISNNKFIDMSGKDNIYSLDNTILELSKSNTLINGNIPFKVTNFTLGICFSFLETGTNLTLLSFNNIFVKIYDKTNFELYYGSNKIYSETFTFETNINYKLFLALLDSSIVFKFFAENSGIKIDKKINIPQVSILTSTPWPIIGEVKTGVFEKQTKSKINLYDIILYDVYLHNENINKLIYNLKSRSKLNRVLPSYNLLLDFKEYTSSNDKLKFDFTNCNLDSINYMQISRPFYTDEYEFDSIEFTFIVVFDFINLNLGSNIFGIFNTDNTNYLSIRNSTSNKYKDTIRFQFENLDETNYICNLPKIEKVKNILISRIKGSELYFEQITNINKVPKIVKKSITRNITKGKRKLQIGDSNVDFKLYNILLFDRALHNFELETVKENIFLNYKFYE